MNEEKRILTAFNLSRISEKHSTFYAFMSQKSESLTHSFFFDGFRSKVIFRVTQNSLCILLNYFPKTLLCEAGGHTLCSRWLQWVSPPHSLLITGCGLQALCIISRWSILLRLTGMSILKNGFIVFKKE